MQQLQGITGSFLNRDITRDGGHQLQVEFGGKNRGGNGDGIVNAGVSIQEEWVKEVKCVGVTAGASAPDILVQNVVARLQQLGGGEAIPLEGREENIVFEVPKELRVDIREVD